MGTIADSKVFFSPLPPLSNESGLYWLILPGRRVFAPVTPPPLRCALPRYVVRVPVRRQMGLA